MTIGHALYQLIIGPLVTLYEAVFYMANYALANCAKSIFVLSMVVNILVLPLYNRADAVQAEERELEKRMEPWIRHIRRTFRGDERFMMLQTYYRQNNYSPLHTLRGSIPLLLEIPFFIAAYRFLSTLSLLNGASLGPIADLGAPDGLISVAGVSIHLLPILMTAINFVSSAIYTKGHPRKEKLQLFAMALIFLVLLYNSPSGLVFYWTLNNLFSLGKNLVQRSRRGLEVLAGALLAVGTGLFVYTAFIAHIRYFPSRVMRSILCVFPILFGLLTVWILRRKKRPAKPFTGEADTRLFLAAAGVLAVLMGLWIPSSVVASSPEEFVILSALRSPQLHVLNAFLLSAGAFLVWFGLFYYLADRKGKYIFSLIMSILAAVALADYLFTFNWPDVLFRELQFERMNIPSLKEQAINLLMVAAVTGLVVLCFRKKRELLRGVVLVLALASLGISAVNIVRIQKAMPDIRQAAENASGDTAEFTLSREGKNVVVLMLDRAISAYLPYMLQEKPELAETFDGFTYYPNTVSYGCYTNFASPPLYGGYEYTPEEMNKRSDMLLVDKHDEALLVMPTLFDQAGYEVTVCDPPYAGYTWVSDLSIFDGLPDVHTYLTEHGEFSVLPDDYLIPRLEHVWNRNFFCYSLMRCVPTSLRLIVYMEGSYLDPNHAQASGQTASGLSKATGLKKTCMDSYAVLYYLPEITHISPGGENTFLSLCNSITHEAMLFQTPDYLPMEEVDNTEYDQAHQDRFTVDGRTLLVKNETHMTHYHVNMAALMVVGRWMDYLRENGVYDNTRIIIVSDHGRDLNQIPEWIFNESGTGDVMFFNPLLLVKDFDAHGFTTDDRFMTNADVPTLALAGLIEDPVNPYTGHPVNDDAKFASQQHILASTEYRVGVNNGKTFLPGEWYAVHDDIFNLENWSELGVR